MKMTDFLKKRFLIPLLYIILLVFIFYKGYHFISPTETSHTKAYKVPDGWGYQVIIKEKVIIDQPFIPVLEGKKPFPTKKSALKAGEIVKERLINRQRPAFTEEDLELIGLDSLGNLKQPS